MGNNNDDNYVKHIIIKSLTTQPAKESELTQGKREFEGI